MSNFPFGFNPGSQDDDNSGDDADASSASQHEPSATDPLAALLGGGGGDIGAAFQRLGQLLSWQGGPVNWDLARDVARQVVAAAGDRSVTTADREPVLDAMRLAELWLDEASAFPSGVTGASAWSRAEWVEATLPAWQELVDPLAAKVVDSMGTMFGGEDGPMTRLGLPPEQLEAISAMAALTGPMQQMMRSVGGAMFGSQVGQAIGSLAVDVVGSTDVGLPLSPDGRAALLPANVAAFGAGLEVPADQVRLYLALREAAHHRLFASAPWLRGHLMEAVAAYARGIHVDPARLEEAMGSIDPSDPESMQRALTGGMFEPEDTPAQQAALARLETALALVEGWVDEVVDAAATPHLPSAAALRETVRRRRASGGPGEQTFASLVGLELRPRRLRDAATLWRAVLAERGQAGREAVWAHPDLLPTAADLDDPLAFATQAGEASVLDLSTLDETVAPPEPPAPPTPPTSPGAVPPDGDR
ncbi:MAG: zinc-dependent metalloprotease [Spirochaetaceae bacterium]|nr:zinc-dependent metalloprotease [Spirochaetaceae bacterium]